MSQVSTIQTSAETPRSLYVPVGVKDTTEPNLIRRVNKLSGSMANYEDYRGVQRPFNLFSYLLKAEEEAVRRGTKWNILSTGASRLIKKYDVQDAERILSGQGDSEEMAYFDNLLKLEQISAAISRAVGDVLQLEHMEEGMFLSTEAMRDDRDLRERVFQDVRYVQKNMMEVLARPNDFFGIELSARDAFRWSLPSRKRSAVSPENGGNGEVRYLLTEAGLIHEVIAYRHGRYISHVGSDTSFYSMEPGEEEQKKTITECLRMAVIGCFGRVPLKPEDGPYGPKLSKLLSENWETLADFDGGAFRRGDKGGSNFTHGDPYYLESEHIAPKDLTSSVNAPLRIPGVPWREGWLGTFARASAGGIEGGQASAVIREFVHPVMQRYLEKNGDRGQLAMASSGDIRGHKLGSLLDWVNPDTEQTGVIPFAFGGVGEFNDAVRVVCGAIADRALELVKGNEG